LLTEALEELKSSASRFGTIFADEVAGEQWRHHQAGRLATAAMVLAAAQRGPSLEEQDGETSQAAIWAMRRFSDLRREIFELFDEDRQKLSSSTILDIVNRYQLSIGDVEQQMAGEGHAIDALLRRHGGEGADAEGPGPAHAPYSPEWQTRAFAAGTEEKSLATVNIVCESVVKWLRAEKRRSVDRLDGGTSFSSLGMDSLGAITFALELERRTGVELGSEVIYECETISGLAAYIDANVDANVDANALTKDDGTIDAQATVES
jgi:acyl carrier protein